MGTTTTDKLAAALREALSFLGSLHASNANAALADGRAALAAYDAERAS